MTTPCSCKYTNKANYTGKANDRQKFPTLTIGGRLSLIRSDQRLTDRFTHQAPARESNQGAVMLSHVVPGQAHRW